MSAVMERRSEQSRLRTQLIGQLVRKDLKIKYQGSTLGFAWSLANPLLLLVVYTFVFQVVFRSNVPLFGYFLMSGLLIWNFFQMGVMGASTSITGNAGLVKKVPFPHIALPLSSIGFAGVQVLLQFIVLIVAMTVTPGYLPLRPQLLLLVPALVVVLTLTLGLALFVAAATVRFKDTQHILEVLMFAWMWLSGIIYPPSLVHDFLGTGTKLYLYYLNPMAGVTATFQRAIYGRLYDAGGHLILASDSDVFYLKVLGLGFVVSAVIFVVGYTSFRNRSADFAEDL